MNREGTKRKVPRHRCYPNLYVTYYSILNWLPVRVLILDAVTACVKQKCVFIGGRHIRGIHGKIERCTTETLVDWSHRVHAFKRDLSPRTGFIT